MGRRKAVRAGLPVEGAPGPTFMLPGRDQEQQEYKKWGGKRPMSNAAAGPFSSQPCGLDTQAKTFFIYARNSRSVCVWIWQILDSVTPKQAAISAIFIFS